MRNKVNMKKEELFSSLLLMSIQFVIVLVLIVVLNENGLVLAHDQFVTYRNTENEIEKTIVVSEDNDTLLSSDETQTNNSNNLSKTEEMIDQTVGLIDEANELLEQQKRMKYKYEEINLPDSLKNEVIEVSNGYNIDPDIMFSIYYVESRFNVNASNSSSTARGLGQILKGTARECYRKVYGSNNYNHDLAYNPHINIKLTSYLLSSLYERSGGNYRIAIQNYNGGDSKVSYAQEVLNYYNSLKSREANYGN